MTMTVLVPLAAVALMATPTAGGPVSHSPDPAAAPQTLTAWHGCWSATDSDAAAMVCVLPGSNAASARIVTLENDEIVEETVLAVDGVARQVAEGGCTGTQTAWWSQDGRRVMLRTALDCDGVQRVSTGIIAMVAENEWVDVQTVSVGAQHASRTLRYRAVRPENAPDAVASLLPQGRSLVLESARLEASAALDMDAVMEASRLVAAPVVEALLAARRQGFSLNAQRLVQLERAGVPASTIDMMIALSYPRTFAVQEAPRQSTAYDGGGAWRPAQAMVNDCYDPFFASRMSRTECDLLLRRTSSRYGYGYGGSMYGIGSRYGYSPWGYDSYGWNMGRGPTVIIVRGDDEQRGRGEVVKGHGYTGSGTATGRNARTRAEPSAPRPSGAGASSSQPAATSTSGSGSSTSSGTTTGRTAVPRTSGGGQEQQPPGGG
jgi:hypothetical protein